MIKRLEAALISAVFVATLFAFTTTTTYAANCTREQAALKARGQNIPCEFSQRGDHALLSGGCPDAAGVITYLKSKTGNKKSIDGLQPEFACNLKKFIEAAPGNITIGVGTYQIPPGRTVEKMGKAYCRVMQCKGGSESHPRGLAADLIYDGNTMKPPGSTSIIKCNLSALCLWAHKNAAQYGLVYRLMPAQGYPQQSAEAWHIELGNTPGAPTSQNQGPQKSGAPLQAGSDKIRELLGAPKQAALDPALGSPAPKEASWVNSAFSESGAPADAPKTPTGVTSADTAKDALAKLAALDTNPESAAPQPPAYVNGNLAKEYETVVTKAFSETPKVPDSNGEAKVYFTGGSATGFDTAGEPIGPSAFQQFLQCFQPFSCPLLSRGEEI